MLGRVSLLAKKSIKSYTEGGLDLFLKRTKRYLIGRYENAILFRPFIPPIVGGYKNRRVGIGYRDKYVHNNSHYPVSPSPSDTVVEVGVSHGRDTAMYGKLAKRVIAFEPSPRNYKRAKKNLERFDNIELINQGLWYEEDKIEIKYGEASDDDGFLEPDSGTAERGPEIPVTSLRNYIETSPIDGVDFLKVEAEGAEPEIIRGIGDLRIPKIAVNAGEERDGLPTGKAVMELLQPRGYNLVAIEQGHILFFTLDPVSHSAFRSLFE